MTDRLSSIRATLRAHGQEHLLTFHDQLTPDQRAGLLDQLARIDLAALSETLASIPGARNAATLPANLEPAPYHPYAPDAADSHGYRKEGEQLIGAGKVAVFVVAGGQATRLGWSGPKGTFPATVVTGKPLFRLLAEQIVANQDRYRVEIPLYIMTSPLNDAATRAFFTDNNCFGLNRRSIFMFPQGMLPSVDAETGKLLLADTGTVAMNPDGHGGSIRALTASGALEDMANRGIEHISYVQVDNPLVKVIDPLFIGLHATAADSSAEMSSKMVPKIDPGEKVGVFARSGPKTVVIEYTDFPEPLASERDPDGQLRFRSGSIAIHMMSVEFLQRLAAAGEDPSLPIHMAARVVPFVDLTTGDPVTPEAANAYKLETFVFDALPLAKRSVVMETSRVEEFAPIKNAGGVDSPATSHQLQSDRSGRWLEMHGVEVPRDGEGHVAARIELSPLTALECRDLAKVKLPRSIAPGETVLL